jgi:NitT/TauT family transport system substrate-binding protein
MRRAISEVDKARTSDSVVSHPAHSWSTCASIVARLFTCFLCLLVLPGCDRPPEAGSQVENQKTPITDVALALNWYPEAEHGGFYAALVHGYYEQAGLRVTIVPGGPGAPVLQEVATRKVAFGVEAADRVLLGRAQGADVVAVMAPLQNSPRCIMVHKQSGIISFDQLQNLTLAISTAGPWALFLQKRLPLEGVQLVPYPGNVAEFLINDNYAQQAYVFSEPFVATKAGGDPHCLMVSDLGFNPYTSVLVTSNRLIQSDPELVERMVQATVRGWHKYLEDPATTNGYIHEQNPEMDLDILAYGADAIRPLCVDGTRPLDQLGTMTAERWQTLAEQMVEAEAIDAGAVEPTDAFTTRFLTTGTR